MDVQEQPGASPSDFVANPIARFAVTRRVTMGMAVLGVLVLGWISLTRLPLEYLPAFSSSNISVNAPYRSSSPQEIERLIVRPLESSLATVSGIETLSATATASNANVNITFIDGTDMDLAAVEVRDRVDRVRHLLPADLEQVRIRRFQSTDIPVLRFHVTSDWPSDRLYYFAENVIQRRLERLEGVAQVAVNGLRSRQLQINLDPARMRSHRVDVRQLTALLRANNMNLSAGYITEGSRKLLVRSVGELATLEEIRALPIGGGLRLSDVAEVVFDFPEQQNFTYLNGSSALTVSINKSSTANLLEVVEAVKAEIAEVNALPEAEGLYIRVYSDASKDVRQGLSQLAQAGLLGAALAVLFVYFFLRRIRTTLLVAIAIPLSVILTFSIMFLMRQAELSEITLNVVSLMGMMLALGMLVDNSIVVIESIFRHRQDEGRSAVDAALAGTSEVALPIAASTLTTICVFIPSIFLAKGGFSRFMSDAGTTIVVVMVASLIVALTVVPMVAAFLLAGESVRKSAKVIDWMTGLYARVIDWTLRYRVVVVVVAATLAWGAWHLLGTIERSFSGRSTERQVTINIDTPRNYSLAQIQGLYGEVAGIIEENREDLDLADFSYEFSRSGGRSRGGWRGGRRFEIYLVDEEEGQLTTAQARDRLRELMPVKAGVGFKVGSEGRHGRSGVTMELMGDDPAVLARLSAQIQSQLQALPGVKDVDSSLESGDQELRVVVNRERALAAGLSSLAVAMTVNNSLSGRALSYFKTEDREIEMIMQYAAEDRETLDQLKNVPVFVANVALPIGALADFSIENGPRSIDRQDRRARVTITADTATRRASFGLMGAMRGIMGSTSLPPGYEWSFGRWERHAQKDAAGANFAWIFAIALVYMILAALFESFAQPLTIICSVPFALIGVALVMKVAGQPRDSMTDMGAIILVGVVVNNAIVLIDYINRLRRRGMERNAAIVAGGRHRLRPILMTAVTTILGLSPMVAPYLLPEIFGQVEGRAAQWAPVGLVILGGLTTSTFFTLILTPTIYSLVDDVTRIFKRAAATA